jgi:hypothetical protein
LNNIVVAAERPETFPHQLLASFMHNLSDLYLFRAYLFASQALGAVIYALDEEWGGGLPLKYPLCCLKPLKRREEYFSGTFVGGTDF